MKELLGCWGVELFYESGKGDCLKCSSNKKGMCRLEILKRKQVETKVIREMKERKRLCTKILNEEE